MANPGRERTIRGRAWVSLAVAAVLGSLLLVCLVRAETNGLCSRCGVWVKLSPEGEGLDRAWMGLCGACQDPKRRCDEVIDRLERQVEWERDQLGYHRRELERARHHEKNHGPDAQMPSAPPGVTIGEFIDQHEWALGISERHLEDARRRLANARAECGLDGGVGAAGDGPGGGPPGPADPATTARDLRDRVESLSRLSRQLGDQIRALESQVGTLEVDGAPIEAAQLDRLGRHTGPIVAAEDSPEPGATASEATAEETAPPASLEEPIRPELADVGADLPRGRIPEQIALWERCTANAAACARGVLASVEQVEAAEAAGNPERARRHRERAACLAAKGQAELRQAAISRNEVLWRIYGESVALAKHAEEGGRTVEQALSAWQAEVRANGLPSEYAAALRQAGASEEQIAKRKEWLQGVDAAEAARTHARFLGRIALRNVAEARGEQNAAPPLPEPDALWDIVTIRLLRAGAAGDEGR